jgi:hypothetical protein
MPPVFTLSVIVSSLVQLVVSVFIFKKGRKNLSYQLFFALSLTVLLWSLMNYASIVAGNSPHLIVIVRIIMFLAVLQLGIFYLFSNAFPHSTSEDFKKEVSNFAFITLLVAIIALTPLLFASLTINNGVIQPEVNAGVFIFIFYAFFCIYNSFKVLIRKVRGAIGLKRAQLVLIIIAGSINWILIPLTNFVLTLSLKTTLFVKLSPFFSLLFACIIGYALARRRLFDAKTNLRNSTIYVEQHIKNPRDRAYEYYELQTLVYEADSNHVALDFSGVKSIDKETVHLLKNLRKYMKKQGKQIYFVGYSQKVFKQLKPNS